ncbi:hypothetical protein Ancab_040542 [Ancistrocladus abbreviatus]
MMHTFSCTFWLQVAVRKTLTESVAIPLMRLGAFFYGICSKVLKPKDLDHLQCEIIETLCQLDRIFPPNFFDVMVHLPIHLIDQIKLVGQMQYHFIYWMERYLCQVKPFIHNRSHLEGSIAKGYLAEECLTFCSRYIHDGVKTRFNQYTRNFEEAPVNENPSPIFPKVGHPIEGNREGKARHLF